MPKQLTGLLRVGLRLGLTLCLAALPFELAAGLRVGPLTLTNLELLLLASVGLWAALLVAERRWPAVPLWLSLGAATFVGALLLSALLATAEQAGALKFALRQGQGALLALCLADTLCREGGARRYIGALLAGAGLSAMLGLAELSEAPAIMAALAPFKTESSYMGGLLRLSASFSYANTAAQFFEALLPLSLLVAVRCWAVSRRLVVAAGFALSLLLLLATLFTYSRAALLVTGLLLLATPLGAWWAWGRGAGRSAALLCAGLAAVGLLLVASSPTFRVRILEPDVANWYSVRYTPTPVAPMAPSELRSVPITLRNSGWISWDPAGSRPVRLAYHWLDAASGQLVRFEGRRTLLPHPVEPGASVTLSATIQAPARPGRYLLAWDMLRESIGRGWFSQMGTPPARVAVEVGGVPPVGVQPPPPERPATLASIAPQPGPPGRRALWGVALELWRERPALGIGPDVYRHIYGQRLGLRLFDQRVHTNNLYLELLTGAGLLGLGSFLSMIGLVLWRGLVATRQTASEAQPSALLPGALLGIVAVLAHGTLDVFLAFTPTYALLWALIGSVAGLQQRAIFQPGSLRIIDKACFRSGRSSVPISATALQLHRRLCGGVELWR